MAKKKSDNPDQLNLLRGKVPQMPEGYYLGDKPNPNLRAFVEAHLQEHPYDPDTDNYNVPAFDKPINATKATAIYNMHTYWSKKPHDAIRQYIRHYTKPGDLVLDPFCGSGGTALAALTEGRKAIAIDRSPAATFITKNYCTPVDVGELNAAFEELKRQVKPEIDWLYETKCDRCGGKATTGYTVYSQVFQCPRCLQKVPLFDCVEVEGRTAKGKPKKVNACPHCFNRGQTEIIRSQGEKFGSVPVLVSYICERGCKPKRDQRRHNEKNTTKQEYFEKYDIAKIREIESKQVSHWYPQGYDMTGFSRYQRDALYYYGVKEVADLFTKRNLCALATILNGIKTSSQCQYPLLFTFTSILLKSSRMMAHNNDGIGRIQKGTYYIPQLSHDIHAWQFMEEAISDMASGYLAMERGSRGLMITTSDARFLDLPNSSIEYIFTDPPYAEKVQYGELNFAWEAWLGLDTQWHDNEIIVNEVRGKTEVDWTDRMLQVMKECHRVLKPGRCISLSYHDTSEGTWALLQDLMAEAGFVIERTDSALYIDTKARTTNQYFADKVNKRDLVINFRKPKPNELASDFTLTGNEDETTFNEKVRVIIRDYLTTHPGETKDRIYDEVVSRMVRSGRMEAHNFDELLTQVAEQVRDAQLSRWYLKETEVAVVDAAESAKEDAAAKKVGKFIADWLKQHPVHEGVHYSDMFEHYIYAVPSKDKPRRQLQDWLLDYFYKTPEGTYRLPVGEEEADAKTRGRAAGTNRRVKRFLAYLQQGLAVPLREMPNDSTLAEWIRHCKRSGLYEQGKLLYERGGLNLDNLPEEVMVNVEEDYQVCVRMLSRSGEAKSDRSKTKAKKSN